EADRERARSLDMHRARRAQVVRRANGLTGVSLVMSRNALDAFGQEMARRRIADGAQTEDADHPLALVDHGQPAHLELLHVPHRLGEVIVVSATMDAWGHHIARRRAADIEAVLRQAFADDVAVGHHADQMVVLSNRNGADVMLAHQFREFGDGNVRTDPVDALVHRVFDFHGESPLLSLPTVDEIQPRFPRGFDYTTDLLLWHGPQGRPNRRKRALFEVRLCYWPNHR